MLKINKSDYQGYIWLSDSKQPEIIDGEYSAVFEDTDNPFVIEGQLYDSRTGTSISIKHADGHYYVHEYTVRKEDLNSKDNDTVVYVPHRIPKISGLKFLQRWVPEADELCCGMKALVPAERIFIGFEKSEK